MHMGTHTTSGTDSILIVILGINPFTLKSDQLQFSFSVSHQRYIIQYGEFDNR